MTETKPDIYFSKSAAESYFRCPRLWKAKYPEGVREVARSLLPARGNVLHAACNHLLLDKNPIDGMLRDPDWGVIKNEGNDEELLCHAVCRGIELALRDFREQVQVLGTEQKLTRDDNTNYTTRIDNLRTHRVRFTVKNDGVLSDGRPFVFELKTTKSYINHQYWSKAEINFQTHYYLDEIRTHHGFDVDRCCWQVVKLPTQKMYRYSEMGLAPKAYVDKIGRMMASDTMKWFPFVEIPWSDKRIEQMRNNRDYLVTRMLVDKYTDWAGQNTGACFDFQRRCELYPVCHEDDTVQNKELYTLRTDR